FDAAGALVGVTEKNAVITVERWSNARTQTWPLTGMPKRPDGKSPAPAPKSPAPAPMWAISRDASEVAWIWGKTLYCQRAGDQPAEPAVSIDLPKKRSPLAVGLLADGSVAVPFEDSSVGRWDCSTGETLAGWSGRMRAADQAIINDDYIAMSSA